VYGTCNAQGTAYSESITDCAASKKLCSPNGCVTSIVEEIGKYPSGAVGASKATFFGNVVGVNASRKLTQIAIDMQLPQSAQLTWAVYKFDGGSVFTPVSKTTTTQAAVDGFATSGALAVTLSQEQAYLIGVIYTPPAGSNSGVRIGCQGEPGLSFGYPEGDYFADAPTSPDQLAVPTFTPTCSVHQMVTTTLP
jgi:hypothetical protein